MIEGRTKFALMYALFACLSVCATSFFVFIILKTGWMNNCRVLRDILRRPATRHSRFTCFFLIILGLFCTSRSFRAFFGCLLWISCVEFDLICYYVTKFPLLQNMLHLQWCPMFSIHFFFFKCDISYCRGIFGKMLVYFL